MTGRRKFLSYFSSTGLSSTLFPGVLWATLQAGGRREITKAMLDDAAAVSGLLARRRGARALLTN